MNDLIKMDAIEEALARGNVGQLNSTQRVQFLAKLNESVGTNPLTSPFQFLTLQGRTVIYASKSATDQLRKIHGVSVKILDKTINNDSVMVHVRATDKTGREDEDVSVVIAPAKDPNRVMKAVTKAKRRVTLSICGLGILDETEIETIPGAQRTRSATQNLSNVIEGSTAPEEQEAIIELSSEAFEAKSLIRKAKTLAELDDVLPKLRAISEMEKTELRTLYGDKIEEIKNELGLRSGVHDNSPDDGDHLCDDYIAAAA